MQNQQGGQTISQPETLPVQWDGAREIEKRQLPVDACALLLSLFGPGTTAAAAQGTLSAFGAGVVHVRGSRRGGYEDGQVAVHRW